MNIVVVGGGSAGWITALYAKKAYPEDTVTLVESEEYGILGAGEGGTPQLKDLLHFLDIRIEDLIVNCGSTIKNGIRFTNWQGTGDHFYHPFASHGPASNDDNYTYNAYLEDNMSFSHVCAARQGHRLSDYSLIEKISEQEKIPFLLNNTNDTVKFEDIYTVGNWSIHFDAKLLANFLRKTGEERGIARVEGIVEKIETDSSNNVTKLWLTADMFIDVDFVFDCSGFRRLIIGNFYKSRWKSYSEYLPAKKAIPFFLDPEKTIKPYTESVAMKYGWMWKIPLQHRSGCGYVFDTNFISEDEAKKEIDEYLGYEVQSPKTFTFSPGCYEKIWINNCLAVGLSSSFTEPLEATSMWQTVNVLRQFFSRKTNLTSASKFEKDKFNQRSIEDNQHYVNLIYLHYLTTRKDTKFWKNFSVNNKMPEFIEYVLEVIKHRSLTEQDFDSRSPFTFMSYGYVLLGNGLIDTSLVKKYELSFLSEKERVYKDIVDLQEEAVTACISHDDFISKIKRR